MGISALDIKIRKSQRLTDNADGGGRMVAAEVVDGQLNNLFPDISTQDRVSGRVSMRKGFVHVDTPNTDVLYGAVGVIVEPPEDDNVHVTMFSTGSYSDTRADARNRIESYITKGVESRYVLYGDHFIGQRAINVYCLKDAPTPEINETFCLSVEQAGYTPVSQYVRVQEVVSRTTQSFYDNNIDGLFQRDVIVIAITTPLGYDFPGQEVSIRTNQKPPTRVRLTNVSDASSYYSVKRLTAPAQAGDLVVKLDSPFVPLVPTTQAETPVVDQLAGLGTLAMVQSGAKDSLTMSFNATFAAGAPVTRYLGSPCTRGGVRVIAGGTTLNDDGRGVLVAEGGSSVWSGSVDYQMGSVTLTNSAGTSVASVSITATPAGPVLAQGFTARIDVTAANRQLNYVMQLRPLPYAGTVTVDYLALGKWIRLSDNGTGQLSGNPGQGSGSVNYATGSLVVTLGALPDVESAIIVSFGTDIQTEMRTGAVAATPALLVQLPGEGTAPGSVTLSYTVDGTTATATDGQGDGVLRNGTTPVGRVDYAGNRALLAPQKLPDAATSVTATAASVSTESEVFTPTYDGNGIANLDLGGAVNAGSVALSWVGQRQSGETPAGPTYEVVTIRAKDDGAGNIVATAVGSSTWTATLGAINYAAGLVTVKVDGNNPGDVRVPIYGRDQRGNYTSTGYKFVPGTVSVAQSSPVSVSWQIEGAPETPGDVVVPPGEPLPAVLDLTPDANFRIVPGSVRFNYAGRTFVDRNGSLYHSIDPVSGSGLYGGTIDYVTGQLNIVDWLRGEANSVTLLSLLLHYNEVGKDHVDFRTPGAPLRPGSFILRATTLHGALLTATADLNGNISGADVIGVVDWKSGAASVRFGHEVDAAGNENEPWYDPSLVVGGKIFRPELVDPATVYFGTVVYRNIPLNPAILGLDPVRLPEDGRVVAFRPGQTVLVHHTQEHTVASPAPGQIVDFGRTNVSRVEVRDSAGTPVDPVWFSVNRATGKLTFSNPLNLAAYTLPIVIRDRIEDRVLVADASITGEIALNRALAHDYPQGGHLSTCLILGEMNGSQDLQARVENIFDQATWTGVFSDSRIGNGTDAQFNDVVYPIVVSNDNAITERWAVRFTNPTSFEVIGETVGIIATGTTLQNCAPVNPRTGEPYFFIPKDGWGSGWSAGNVLRFNTVGGLAPVWFIRTTLAGEMEEPADAFRFEVLGDANP